MAAGNINDLKKQAEAYAKAISASEKSALEMQKTFGQISASLLDLSVSDFFKEMDRSPEVMMQLEAEVKKLTDELKNSGVEINKIFSSAFKNTAGGTALDKLEAQTLKLKTDFPEVANLLLKELDTIKNSANPTIKSLDFASIMAKSPIEAAEFSKALLGTKASAGKLEQEIEKIVLSSMKLNEVQKDLAKTTKEVFDPKQGFEKFIQRNFSLGLIIKDILNYDEQISKAQRETGILIKDNTEKMSQLAIQGARFGLSVSDMTGFMGDLGEILKTTNFNVLSKAAIDTQAISMATGLSNQEVAQLTGQFLLLGQSSEEVKDFVQQTANESKRFGLNTKNVLGDITKNASKFRQMGFQGGEDSLKRMVMTAQRLRMNVDEIFNVDEKARSIEGAMEMAAELQLAGGSFSRLDPMQLLSAARKGPEELTKILSRMGEDVGHWVTDMNGNKKYQFDPTDHDRLEMVAKATGLTIENLQNQIVKGAEKTTKQTQGLFNKIEFDEDTKNMVDQMTTLGKGGKIEFTGAFENFNEDEFKRLSQAEIKSRLDAYKKDTDNLEEQAKQNMSFEKSLSAFKNSLMNVFSALEPIIKGLTWAINLLNDMPVRLKQVLVGAFTAFVLARKMGFMGGVGGGMLGSIGKIFGGGAGTQVIQNAAQGAGNIAQGAAPAAVPGMGMKIEATLTGIANGIKAFGQPGVFKGALGLILSAPGLILMTAALPFLLGISLLGEAAGAGLAAFGEGLAIFGTAVSAALPEILLGELVLAGFGVALIPFAYALSLLSPLIDSFGKIIIGVFSAIPPIITALADGFVTVAKGLGDMAVNLIPLAPGLFALAPALIAAAFGFTAFFLAFANPFAIFGMTMMVMSLGSLNTIMSTLAPNLDIGAKSINAMADGVKNLSSALSSINTDTLDKLKGINESAGNSALANAVSAITNFASGTNNQTQKFEITVVVQDPNGRELNRRILKDTDLIK